MKKLNILMCSQFPLTSSLGGPKGYLEIAHSYRHKGHIVDVVGINELVGEDKPYLDELWRIKNFPKYLREYILRNSHKYDVIEYEAIYLPFNIKDQVKSILVARSVLLELHLRYIKIPVLPGPKALLGHHGKALIRNYNLNQRIGQSLMGMKFADFVNVSNPSDQHLLIKHGIPSEKIVMQPYGITKERLELFNEARSRKVSTPDLLNIAFVGSFDKRKGAVEFPAIIRNLTSRYPRVKFKLMGITGLFRDKESIVRYLGADLRDKVTIIERYRPEELPDLLVDCSLGIFPSHLESFGFGVLEMMSMGLPVVGYDSPGINMLIPPDLQVERGDVAGIIDLLSKLIEDSAFALKSSKTCLARVSDFIYESQDNASLKAYLTPSENKST